MNVIENSYDMKIQRNDEPCDYKFYVEFKSVFGIHKFFTNNNAAETKQMFELWKQDSQKFHAEAKRMDWINIFN